MSDRVEDITVEYEDNGQILVRELDKVILTRGAWATLLFRYQDWRPAMNDYGPEKYAIRRYHKEGGEYRQQSKFVISSADQARKIIAALQEWIGPEEPEAEKPVKRKKAAGKSAKAKAEPAGNGAEETAG